MRRSLGQEVRELQALIRKGKISPVYLFFGPESYLIEELIAVLRKAILGDQESSDWNEERLHADDTSGAVVVERANTSPFGGGQRLIVVGGIEAWREKDTTPLVGYLENPSPNTILVMTATKADRRTKLVRLAGKVGISMRFDSLRERDLVKFLPSIAKKYGKRLSDDAAELLVVRCGESLRILVNELAKLALYVGTAEQITVDDVAKASAGQGSAQIFAMCDAVAEGKIGKALSLLQPELTPKDRAGPIRVTAMLARHFRLLIRARSSHGNLGQALGLPPFIANKYGVQAKGFSLGGLQKAHALLFRADGDLKGASRVPPLRVVEHLVLELCSLSQAQNEA